VDKEYCHKYRRSQAKAQSHALHPTHPYSLLRLPDSFPPLVPMFAYHSGQQVVSKLHPFRAAQRLDAQYSPVDQKAQFLVGYTVDAAGVVDVTRFAETTLGDKFVLDESVHPLW
jgi:hypothetical protein